MNFAESESYLLSLGNEVSAMKLGLENIRKLLHAIGDPQNNYLKVQVAGTNGKGSVCAFLNSICVTAGIRTGMYTSPHLVSMTERVKISGDDIAEEDFARLATQVREISEKLVASGDLENVPTYFEQVTAIGLLAFAEAKVELGILETGLGGRLDATTAANAEIAAITRIDLDHQRYLGETIEEIAAEKAAIIHEGSKVVILRQSHVVEQVIAGRCREVGVEPTWTTNKIRVTRDWDVRPGVVATFETERASYVKILLWGMLGDHQVENAPVAVGIAEILQDAGLSIDSDAITIGLERASHPGRLEFYDGFLFDGAHNIGGAKALRKFLDEFVDQPVTMIFGSMGDKAVGEIASVLFPRANKLILTQPDNSRALDASELRRVVPDGFDQANVFVTNTVLGAIEKAREVSNGNDLILVTGSLYLVGEVRRIVGKDTLRNN